MIVMDRLVVVVTIVLALLVIFIMIAADQSHRRQG